MSDEIKAQEAAVVDISRRDSIRLARHWRSALDSARALEAFGKTPTAVRHRSSSTATLDA